MRDASKAILNVPDCTLIIRYHKKCCCMKTPGQWPWKLESAKKCVKTYLYNECVLTILCVCVVRAAVVGGTCCFFTGCKPKQ